jgi:hypothetical protein
MKEEALRDRPTFQIRIDCRAPAIRYSYLIVGMPHPCGYGGEEALTLHHNSGGIAVFLTA